MKTTINNMLTHVYELEGLLLVMQRRGNDVPQEVIDRYKEIAQIVDREAQLLETVKPEAKEVNPSPPPMPTPNVPPVFLPKDTTDSEPHDITAAFSINDRFLFLRELFDGEQQKFNDTVTQLQKLHNMNEVDDFVTSELQWDMSNDVVKEFMRLIELGFQHK